MSTPSRPSLTSQSPQLKIRLPEDILAKVQEEAQKNFRTMSAEIAFRLRQSFERQQEGNNHLWEQKWNTPHS